MNGKLPVTVIFYRRPRLLAECLQAIRRYRPSRLLAVSDGFRPGDAAAATGVLACRQELERAVDWPCQVEKIYADSNLGLKERVESGLSEVFARVPFSVILEEDCVAKPDFFRFIEEIAPRWERNPRVGAVSGNCFLPLSQPLRESYFFSRYPHIWGWATWADRWGRHDRSDAAWPVPGGLESLCPNMGRREKHYWRKNFDRVYRGHLDTWDYRWLLSCWKNGWLSVTPAQNLVGNTGFGAEATNTKDQEVNPGIERRAGLDWPLVHPPAVRRDAEADQAVFANHYLRMEGRLSFWPRLIRSLGKRLLR